MLDRDRYVVGDIKGSQRTQIPYSGVHTGEKLKLYETIVSSDENDYSSTDEAEPARAKVNSHE